MSNAEIGKPVDIWALGVSLYCLIYRKLPFYHDNSMKLLKIVKS